MKKSIFILATFIGITIGFGFMNHFNAKSNNLSFNNYNNTSKGITSNQATSVAFDNDGNVAYTADGNGLTIGIKNLDGTFAFKNYSKKGGNSNFYSDNGTSVTFDKDGNVAYVSTGKKASDPAITFGTKQVTNGDVSYIFKSFGTPSSGHIESNLGSGIAFDPTNDDIAYATSNHGCFLGTKDGNNYTFKPLINGDEPSVTSISMDKNGDIAFSALNTNLDPTNKYAGLNVLRKKSDSYTWSHYKPANDAIASTYSAALSKDGENVAYAIRWQVGGSLTEYGQLGVGTLIDDPDGKGKDSLPYSKFHYYGKNEENDESGISTFAGRDVTFDSSDNIGYATSIFKIKGEIEPKLGDFGLSIGKKNSDGITYSFKKYNSTNTTGIKKDYGTSVAFDNNGNIGYGSMGGGLSIRSRLNVDIDPNTIVYYERSDGNYNISDLTLNFNSLIGDYFLNNQYLEIAITDSDSSQNLNFYAAYLTSDGISKPGDVDYQQSDVYSYPKESKVNLAKLEDINGNVADISGALGFESGEKILITISAGLDYDDLVVLNSYNATVNSSAPTTSNLALELGLALGIGIPIVLISSGGTIYYYFFKKGRRR